MVAKLSLVGLILVAVAFVLDLCFSFGPMWWIYRKVEASGVTTKYNLGLWRECTSIESSGTTVDTCYFHTDDSFSQDKKYLGEVQVFQASGIAFLVVSIVSGILMLFVGKFKDSPKLPPVAALHAFWGGLFFVASVVVAGKQSEDNESQFSASDFHFSFYFALFAAIFALVGAILFLVHIFKGMSGKS